MIDIVAWGIAGSVVDGGRVGRAWLGASRGGAVDLASYELANRVVGNRLDAGVFETSGGLVLRTQHPTMVAVCGAVADVSVKGGPPVGWGSAVVLPAGATLRVARLLEGARAYVAVAGGVAADGSVGLVGDGVPASEPVPRRPTAAAIRVWPGPRLDWFGADGWALLLRESFTVTATSRVGVRLASPPQRPSLQRSVAAELPSEGLVEGAIQVPPDGQPMVMLADHPTTGGYPVIAVVDPHDVGAAAQLPPGATVRFAAAR